VPWTPDFFQPNPTKTMTKPINIIFDTSDGPDGYRFIEVETDDGKSVMVGEWLIRPDGNAALRITALPEEAP
jgi:hypothetical protein